MPELGPGVIGNGLLEPAFMPRREAARAGSSAPFGPNPLGQALPPCIGGGGFGPVPELFGVTAGKEPAGGQVGMESKGEPSPVGGTDPRCAFGRGSVMGFGRWFEIGSGMECGATFGIALDWPLGNCPNAPLVGLCPSGVACHGAELGTFAFGGGPMTIGAFGLDGPEPGEPFQRFAPVGCV